MAEPARLSAQWIHNRHQELSLNELARYPHLAATYSRWQEIGEGHIPRDLGPFDVPRSLLPYVMKLDLEGDGCDPVNTRLRVRLAGTEVCMKHGGEMRGKTTDDFFSADDAKAVVESALQVIRTGRPSLARRDYISLDDRRWGYVRLILPLSRAGDGVDSFFKVLDPETLHERGPVAVW